MLHQRVFLMFATRQVVLKCRKMLNISIFKRDLLRILFNDNSSGGLAAPQAVAGSLSEPLSFLRCLNWLELATAYFPARPIPEFERTCEPGNVSFRTLNGNLTTLC